MSSSLLIYTISFTSHQLLVVLSVSVLKRPISKHEGDIFVHLKVRSKYVTKLGYSQGEVNILSLEESWVYVN